MALSTYANIAKAIVNNKSGRVELPNMATFIVTWRCNLRCFMCDVWKKTDHDDMTVDEIRDIFKQIPHLDSLRITGGEPFLRRDLTEITRAIIEENNPSVVHVTTAGVMTERILEYAKAVGSKKLHLKLSIDAVGARHDEIRGYRGLYDKSMRTLRGLAELRDRYGFYVGVNQTITDRNWDHIEPLRAEVGKLGIQVHYAIATDHYTLYRINTDKEKEIPDMKSVSMSDFTSEQLNYIFEQLDRRDGIKDIPEWLVQNYYLRGLKNRLLNHVESPKPQCIELHNHMRLMPNGDVMTCVYYPTVVGNLRKQSMHDVWYNATTEKQRDVVRKCPGCWAGCEVKPNAIYTGDIAKAFFMGSTKGTRNGAKEHKTVSAKA
ncbi:MAG: radical SAM protein [Chloroflexi bacterium]|nr:radical SAM protein [Chloroflexota bacterium]